MAQRLFQDAAPDRGVGLVGRATPPSVLLHLCGRRHKMPTHVGEVLVTVIEAEDHPAAANPAQRQTMQAHIKLQHPPQV